MNALWAVMGGIVIRSLGFSNVIVSDNNFNSEHLSELFDFFSYYGFRRIVFTLDHDVTSSTPSSHIKLKQEYFQLLKKIKPRGISVWLESNIIMGKDSIYEKQISRLSIKKSDYLLTTFPCFSGKDWIDPTLNYLLYKQKKYPCFMSFERNLATYEPEFLDHLITTRCSCFMIDINSFASPKIIPYINALIDANAVIIPGFCGVIDDYTSLDAKLDHLKAAIGQFNYTKLLVNSSKSSKILLGEA